MSKHLPLIGLVMIALGSVKTWLHMGSVPLLSLPTCTGETVTIALTGSSWLERAHCWGCYMLVGGLAIVLLSLVQQHRERRSVAS